jgi:hypothetical protein
MVSLLVFASIAIATRPGRDGPVCARIATFCNLPQNVKALRFCVISEIDLSQITTDLTVLMAEVDRIEAIAAGKTHADTDEPWPSDRQRDRKP